MIVVAMVGVIAVPVVCCGFPVCVRSATHLVPLETDTL
jgi:hypothetical protein